MLGEKKRSYFYGCFDRGCEFSFWRWMQRSSIDHTTGVGSISLGKWQHKSEIMIWLAEGKRVLLAMTVWHQRPPASPVTGAVFGNSSERIAIPIPEPKKPMYNYILPYFGKRKQVTYHPNLSYWCFHNSHNELFFQAKFHAETLIPTKRYVR